MENQNFSYDYDSVCATLEANGYTENNDFAFAYPEGTVTFTNSENGITLYMNKNNLSSDTSVTISKHELVPSANAAGYNGVSYNGLSTTTIFQTTDENGTDWTNIYTDKNINLNQLFDANTASLNENELNFSYTDVQPVPVDIPRNSEQATNDSSEETSDDNPTVVESPSDNVTEGQTGNNSANSMQNTSGYLMQSYTIACDDGTTSLVRIYSNGYVSVTDSEGVTQEMSSDEFTENYPESSYCRVSATFDIDAYNTLSAYSFDNYRSTSDIDIDDIEDVRNKICDMIDFFQNDLNPNFTELITYYGFLNPETIVKLGSNDYMVDDFENTYVKYYINIINDILNSIVDNLTTIIEQNIEIDNGNDGESPTTGGLRTYIRNGSGGSSNTSSSTPSSTPAETINNIEKVANYDEVMTKYSSVMIATVLFNEITPLYEELGNTTTVQSVQNSEIYKLIGIVKSEDGKYYYQIIDSNTGKIYLADSNSNVTIKWDDLGERKAIEVVGDNAFVLKSTNEGDNMLERVASKNDVYLVNSDKINVDGIDYYSINDNNTGNTAFMPVSDSITEPKLVSEFVKPVTEEVSK